MASGSSLRCRPLRLHQRAWEPGREEEGKGADAKGAAGKETRNKQGTGVGAGAQERETGVDIPTPEREDHTEETTGGAANTACPPGPRADPECSWHGLRQQGAAAAVGGRRSSTAAAAARRLGGRLRQQRHGNMQPCRGQQNAVQSEELRRNVRAVHEQHSQLFRALAQFSSSGSAVSDSSAAPARAYPPPAPLSDASL